MDIRTGQAQGFRMGIASKAKLNPGGSGFVKHFKGAAVAHRLRGKFNQESGS